VNFQTSTIASVEFNFSKVEIEEMVKDYLTKVGVLDKVKDFEMGALLNSFNIIKAKTEYSVIFSKIYNQSKGGVL
jgi:hypothetical protein